MNKIEYTKHFKMVHMDEIDISNETFPIIGTQALGPCVGILVYSEEHKRAIVAHIADNTVDYFPLLLDIIYAYNLTTSKLKYKVIEGYYENGYRIAEVLEQQFRSLPNLFIPLDTLKDNAINKDDSTTSREFAFNAATGEFVTEKVFFGYEYNQIHETNNIKTF